MSHALILAQARRRTVEVGVNPDTCVIARVTGTTTDRSTGVVTATTATVYNGPCRVKEIFGFARDTQPAPDQGQLARYRILHLPVEGSEGVRSGDLVTVTACVHDPDLVDVAMVVRDQSAMSDARVRRIGIEELTS